MRNWILSGMLMVGLLATSRPALADAAADLSAVLGAGAADWKIASPSPGQPLIVESAAAHAPPFECLISFRFKPSAGTAYVSAQTGTADKLLVFTTSLTAGNPYISHVASAPPRVETEKTRTQAGYQYLQAINQISLAWPEEMRKAIESQIAAAPKIEQTVVTMRYTIEPDRFRCWLNGRFVSEIALTNEAGGVVRIHASPQAELVSLSVRPLVEVPRRFETISIAGNLNGAANVDRAALAAAAGAVPFDVPQRASSGGDHIDVSQSWTRFGALPGFFSAHTGLFGGRWVSADRLDSARICLYVPKGRYKALHLLAAADESLKDHVPVVSAQFYRPNAGHPINFSATVPPATPQQKFHHVVIPLDPDSFSWFSDLDRIALEITKQLKYYRGYPDPLEFSWHGGGLPSSVKIYAMTLERAAVDADVQPDVFGHVWTAPAQPSYTMELRNQTGAAVAVKLLITTSSADGKDTTRQEQQVSLPATDAAVKVPIALKPTRYGLHHLTVQATAGAEAIACKRDFAFLHPDTRQRGDWEHGRGALFGFWPWRGGHDTPDGAKELITMAAAGAEATTQDYSQSPPDLAAVAQKLGFITETAFGSSSHYFTGFYSWYNGAPTFDPANPEASGQALVESLKTIESKPGPLSRPTYLTFFAEPHIGPIAAGIWPAHYGEEYKLSEQEQKQFADMLAKYLAGAAAVRKHWPDVKLLFPYGDPMNTVVFLMHSPEARDLIDGCALDLPGFERVPEQQINQVVVNRLYPILKDIKKYKPNPYLVLVEGMCVSSKDLDTGPMGQAEIGIRNYLQLMAYGVYRFESGNPPYECANYWGENHYGGGWCTRLPLAMPTPGYVAWATMTRNLNRANFTKYIPTGSLSTFCQQFKHYKSGQLVHVLWTIRGKRPVSIQVPPGTSLQLHDLHDNVTELREQNGAITFTIDQQPQYLHGLGGDPVVTLGPSDHSDSVPAEHSAKIASLGDGSWKIVEQSDVEYETNQPLQIARFLGKMTASVVDAPPPQGGKALSIHLEKQPKDRGVMPFYTTIQPAKPLTIPGRSNNLGLWVRAASDWGRIVYSVRDAKGEKWISVGTKEDWNNDDIHAWSGFCFDGWRYVRFQMPSNAPYDCYREHGSSWWGSYGGDGIVDLPVTLEKIIIERRPQIIYGAELVEASGEDVLLGDLIAEYADAADTGDEAVRLAKLRMPAPTGLPELSNPIAELAASGVGAPASVLGVADPTYQYDGTRCHVNFQPVAGAKSYDVWVSPYADGRGAMKLGSAWTEPGKLVEGLCPETEFHVFVVYTDADGKSSKPSAPFRFMLKSGFVYK